MGLKCQFVINVDTQKLFIFTNGDDHSINVNLNFLNFLLIWISTFWILLKFSVFIFKILRFYFITSKEFLEICSSKKICLDNLHFLNILAVRISSGALKAAWWDWSGDLWSILIKETASQTCLLKYLFFRKNTYGEIDFLSKVTRKRRKALLKTISFIGLLMV